MKISINEKEIVEARVGDFLVVGQGHGDGIRQIVLDGERYRCLDVIDGYFGYSADSIEKLIERYERNYKFVTVVKSSNVELKINMGN